MPSGGNSNTVAEETVAPEAFSSPQCLIIAHTVPRAGGPADMARTSQNSSNRPQPQKTRSGSGAMGAGCGPDENT